ncbi:hypothetical protein B0H12DRAFT_1029743, partial [Mycena haematopus]
PVYRILLRRPFNVLTELITRNHQNGSQSVTIRGLNSDRHITLPMHARGPCSAEPGYMESHNKHGFSEDELETMCLFGCSKFTGEWSCYTTRTRRCGSSGLI